MVTNKVIQSGAIIRIDPGKSPQAIYFQYNPASVRRTLEPQMVGGQPGGHSGAVRFTGAPNETFSLDIEIEGYDGLATPLQQQSLGSNGVYPAMYALEALLYPPVDQVTASTQRLAQGTLDVAPIEAPTVLLVWGKSRVVPVVVTSYSVTEEAFDPQLNPLRASVSLTVRVLSYSDVKPNSQAYTRFISYQTGKEQLAAKGMT